MLIRSATLQDIENLNKYDSHIDRKELENSIQFHRIYLAEENGEFLGWLRYNLFWDNTPFMNMLFILENNRGKGYGKELVEFWENQMRLLKYKVVMTSTSANEYAQHFYYKLGYKMVGGFLPIEDFYEIILSKELS